MFTSLSTADAGKVRLGGCAPSLATADAGKVRLGGCAPSLATADAGKVRYSLLRKPASLAMGDVSKIGH